MSTVKDRQNLFSSEKALNQQVNFSSKWAMQSYFQPTVLFGYDSGLQIPFEPKHFNGV
jgi:hypothetical protein